MAQTSQQHDTAMAGRRKANVPKAQVKVSMNPEIDCAANAVITKRPFIVDRQTGCRSSHKSGLVARRDVDCDQH